MELNMYTVYDTKAKAFLTPFFLLNDEMAKRAVRVSALNKESVFHHDPSDFKLYFIGVFADDTAAIDSNFPPVCLASVDQLLYEGKK